MPWRTGSTHASRKAKQAFVPGDQEAVWKQPAIELCSPKAPGSQTGHTRRGENQDLSMQDHKDLESHPLGRGTGKGGHSLLSRAAHQTLNILNKGQRYSQARQQASLKHIKLGVAPAQLHPCPVIDQVPPEYHLPAGHQGPEPGHRGSQQQSHPSCRTQAPHCSLPGLRGCLGAWHRQTRTEALSAPPGLANQDQCVRTSTSSNGGGNQARAIRETMKLEPNQSLPPCPSGSC